MRTRARVGRKGLCWRGGAARRVEGAARRGAACEGRTEGCGDAAMTELTCLHDAGHALLGVAVQRRG